MTKTSNLPDSVTFIGNKRSKELHKDSCWCVKRMSKKNRMSFATINEALQLGYDGCGHCLKRYQGISARGGSDESRGEDIDADFSIDTPQTVDNKTYVGDEIALKTVCSKDGELQQGVYVEYYKSATDSSMKYIGADTTDDEGKASMQYVIEHRDYKLYFSFASDASESIYVDVSSVIPSYNANPMRFVNATYIGFSLAKAVHVEVDIYSQAGGYGAAAHRKNIFSGELSAGNHSYPWDGTNKQNKQCLKGKYKCRIRASGDEGHGWEDIQTIENIVKTQSGTETADLISNGRADPQSFDYGTNIKFDLLKESHVKIDIYSQAGGYSNTTHRKTICDGTLAAGPNSIPWDGTNTKDKACIRGEYKCKITVDNKNYYIEQLHKLKGAFAEPVASIISRFDADPMSFLDKTTIHFGLGSSVVSPTPVVIEVFSQAGGYGAVAFRKRLRNQSYTAGEYAVDWNGTNAKQKQCLKGKYKVRIRAGSSTAVIENLHKLQKNPPPPPPPAAPALVNCVAEPKEFDYATNIKFTLTAPNADPVPVIVEVFTQAGGYGGAAFRKVILNKVLAPGPHSYPWNGTNKNNKQCNIGKYKVRIRAAGAIAVIENLRKRKKW